MSKLWTYARCSTHEQTVSAELQDEANQVRAKQLAEEGRGEFSVDYCVREVESATKVAYDERPVFAALMRNMEPDDTLIVWKLDRIDRDPFRTIDCCRWCADHKIKLLIRSLPGGGEIDLSTVMGRTMVMFMAMMNDWWVTNHRDNLVAAIRARKAAGLVYSNRIPYGKKRITENKRKVDIWDRNECKDVVEIVVRYREGEFFGYIARDFAHRGKKRACGLWWAHRQGKARRVDPKHIKACYEWADEWLKTHSDIGGVAVPPETLAKQPPEEKTYNRSNSLKRRVRKKRKPKKKKVQPKLKPKKKVLPTMSQKMKAHAERRRLLAQQHEEKSSPGVAELWLGLDEPPD